MTAPLPIAGSSSINPAGSTSREAEAPPVQVPLGTRTALRLLRQAHS